MADSHTVSNLVTLSITIHRGTHEIGGSCVELRSGNSRLVLDFGYPLKGRGGAAFDTRSLRGKSIPALLAEKILPNIPGLYEASPDETQVEGVLLSHAHMDHHGLLEFVRKDISVYAGAATHELLQVGRLFMDSVPNIKKAATFKNREVFSLGPFTVTPFLMDHSAFDAYAFLVECDGQRVLYSGDFREGGWKHETVERLASVSNGVDVLLLEGTTVGRTAGSAPSTEPVVSGRLMDLFKEFKGKPILVWASAQNIDRVVSMVKACNRAGKMPVVDIYAGMILKRLARTNNRLPHPRLGRPDGMRVFYAERTWKNFRRRNPRYDVPEVLKKPVRIFPEELNRRLGSAVLLVRDSMQDDLQRMENCHDGLLVYSMWSGYKKEENAARFLNWLKGRGFSVEDVHASGHANRESMQKLVNLVAPRLILPIHTERPKEYRNLFPKHKILCLNDGEPYTIPLMGGGLAPTA